MRKTFLGVKLKSLREQRGLTQAALAQLLELSPSYLNQLENNQRPLSVPVLLRLQAVLGVDLQLFSDDEEARLTSQLQEVVANSSAGVSVPHAEIQTMAQQLPALAKVLIRLHRRSQETDGRLASLAAARDDRDGNSLQPHDEVREFFYERRNHIADLDERAEALREIIDASAEESGSDLATNIEHYLVRTHRIILRPMQESGETIPALWRRFDPQSRTLHIAANIEPGRRAFHMATQLAYLDCDAILHELATSGSFTSDESRSLARIGLASYFAGALVLPYGRFLEAAEHLRYDIELLAQKFGVSFETVCHRLSSLQRPSARGVPLFFVRVDRAGNMSKRQSATGFHFSHTGGTCPLWNVYEAFAQPGKVLTQIATMPDGRTYLWIARCISQSTGGYGSPERTFALGLGCDIRHAPRLVYAQGLALNDAAAATPIGPGCRVCERQGCPQRAFPALGKRLLVDTNERLREPYASV